MDVFDLRDKLINDYRDYVSSFIKVRDPRINEKVQTWFDQGRLWPDPMVGLNPTFAPGGTVDDLVAEGDLHPACAQIFRVGKTAQDPVGKQMGLYRHQVEAIHQARAGHNYVLTTGTGSGKSLAYIVPIVDYVLRNPGKGTKAIIVYPMNALANSQEEELRKFLDHGIEGQPVTFARYTGQESDERKKEIQDNPPDIILTNYVMLELILTRIKDRDLVKAAQGLKFLVLDELHTYRGRQGADVGLLVRRLRHATNSPNLQIVGTSATLASGGTWQEQRAAVARVASLLFGAPVEAENVGGETLERATRELDFTDPSIKQAVAADIRAGTPPSTYEEFIQSPLSAWIEGSFGVGDVDDRLVRVTPRSITGPKGAAKELAGLTGADEPACVAAIQAWLLQGHQIARPDGRFSVFAFRLHQFISKGDTVYASVARPKKRFITLNAQTRMPEDHDTLIFPLVFCRACGQDYYSVVRKTHPNGEARYEPADLAAATRGGLHGDLWRQHSVVARALEATGEPALGLLPLGGFLWSAEATAALNDVTIPNEALLSAVRSLTMVKPTGELLQRVDYANLGAEELGSIYEALLEYIPEVNPVAGTFELKATAGNEKKTTGSYYTPTSLINEVLNSALDPVLDEAAQSGNPEQAILDLKVVDPAAGSGHFLIAAANRIADRLARVRAGDDEPSPDQLRTALRDVIGRCIYAVDINPMAIELAKVALWIESMEPGKPLTFIDHHVVCGNGIIGATPAMIIDGIPNDAFTAKPNEGDDRKACTKHKNRNKEAREGQTSLFTADIKWRPADRSADAARISTLPNDSLDEIAMKSHAWEDFTSSSEFARERLIADAHCAAVTFPRTGDSASWMVAPYDVFYQLRDHPDAEIPDDAIDRVREQASRYRFLHWHLAFPEVFGDAHAGSEDDRCGWTGGFDVVLGNPPWDTLSPDRKEFFKAWLPEVASLSSKDQEAAIDQALDAGPQLRVMWEQYRRDLFSTSRFFRRSGRYRMFAPGHLGKGDLNIYRAFVEVALTPVRQGGMCSQITPSGIYAGANNAAIREELLEHFRLLALWGLDNSGGVWFPGVGLKAFAAYVALRLPPNPTFAAGFGIASIDDLRSAVETPFHYPVTMIRAIDARALLIPEVRPGFDAHVMEKLISGRKTFGEQNRERGWHPYRRELDMGNDADLFTKDPSGLPVYEGRMVDFYDHRAKAYISGAGRSSKWTPLLPFDSPEKRIAPQWFIIERDLSSKLDKSWKRYRIGWLDVANPKSDPRCLGAAVIPQQAVCGDTVPTLSFSGGEEWRYPLWLSVANSTVMDFIARRRIGLHMKPYIMDGLPFPEIEPSSYLGRALIDRVLRLTCVSADMRGFRSGVLESTDLPKVLGTPPATDEDDRARLRAEIDALVALECFDLTRKEYEHILDDFTKLHEREEKPPPKGFGEYRTKRLALEAFDNLSLDSTQGG